jgi:endoglucanase
LHPQPNAIQYDDVVVIKDVYTKTYLDSELQFSNKPVKFVVRPKDCKGQVGFLQQNIQFHLEQKDNKQFLANDDGRVILGEDMYVKLYSSGVEDYIQSGKSYGLFISNLSLFNRDGNASFRESGSFIALERVGNDEPYPDIFMINSCVKKGVNHANCLEAPVGKNWGAYPPVKQDFEIIKQAGFDLVRIPVRWDDRTNAMGIINSAWMLEVEKTVKWALEKNLYVMLNIHHFDDFISDPVNNKDKYFSLVAQISKYFCNYTSDLFFELCNEPHKKLNDYWNEYMVVALQIFRQHNRTRTCVIGPAGYNSRQWISKLVLPLEERRTIVTVHYYEPMNFTHYECPYQDISGPTGYTKYWGIDGEEQKKVYVDFQNIKNDIFEKFNLPVNIGEFGTLHGDYNDLNDSASRERWTQTVALACKYNDMSFCYFDLRSIWAFKYPQFALYDSVQKKWIGRLKDMLIYS